MRNLLDKYGFENTESHLNEVNKELGRFGSDEDFDSPEGCAYVTSALITIQLSSVDKLMWYRGQAHRMGIFNSDYNGQPNYKWNGLGFKVMNYLVKNTPIRITSIGSDTVSAENNFMVMAGKSEDKKDVYIIISNYASTVNNFTINISNLPWDNGGNVSYTKNVIQGPSKKFTEETMTIPCAQTINIPISNAQSPSVFLLRFHYNGVPTPIVNGQSIPKSFLLEQNYPNPFNPNTIIVFQIPHASYITLIIYNSLGQEIKTLAGEYLKPGQHFRLWDSTDNTGRKVSSGIYLYQLRAGNKIIQTRKMVVMH